MKPKLYHHMPAFPRTPHLPHNPNKTDDDLLASHADVSSLFTDDVFISEKVDGSNLGMCLWDGYPVIRNKRHFLQKGHLGKNPNKNQLRPVFNWFHDHEENFEALNEHFEKPPVVYGEWMYMVHGCFYDNLPSIFITFAIWTGTDFVPFEKSRSLLMECEFTVPPLLYHGIIENYQQLEDFCNGDSEWILEGDRRREGIYINHEKNRFKMVRSDFILGSYFDKETIIKNKVRKN